MRARQQRLSGLVPLIAAATLIYLGCCAIKAVSANPMPDPLVALSNCSHGSTSTSSNSTSISTSNCSRPITNAFIATGFPSATGCSQTDPIDGGSATHWWQADMVHQANGVVTFVRVSQFLGCCSSVGNPPLVVTIDGVPCNLTDDYTDLEVQVHYCNRTGGTVRVENGLSTPLTLCSVTVYAEYLTDAVVNNPQLSLTNCSQFNGAYSCTIATDGSTSANPVCSYINPGGWWQADTENVTLIQYVRIYNQLFCCIDWPYRISIQVDGVQCAAYNGSYFTAMDFWCNRTGRTLRIQADPSIQVMPLCEVQVFGETEAPAVEPRSGDDQQLSLIGCSQSSIAYGGVCGWAIDNSTLQNCSFCSRTKIERGWLTVRTQGLANVTFIRLFLSTDCCLGRLNNLSVTLDAKQCPLHASSNGSLVQTFNCNETGRTIKVKNNDRSSLALCEVQAFGAYVMSSVQNSTQASPLPLSHCTQSSTVTGGICQRAIDGSTNQSWPGNSCTRTRSGLSWWRAETGNLSHVASVIVYSLVVEGHVTHSINDLGVTVDGARRCSPNPISSNNSFSVLTFQCHGAVGRVIEVRPRRMAQLTLCEVQVLGWPADRKRSRLDRGHTRHYTRRPVRRPVRKPVKRRRLVLV